MTIRTLMNSAGLNSVNLCIYLYPWFMHSMWIHVFFSSCLETHYVLKRYWLSLTHGCCSGRVPLAGLKGTEVTVTQEISCSSLSTFKHKFLIHRWSILKTLTNLLTMVCWWLSSVSQALRENTYPFLAMIMLKDRKMTVVGRLEGLIQPEDLINQLNFIMEANQTYLTSERLER